MADISKITLPDNGSYDIKDAKAREDIAALQASLSGGIQYIGVTTTPITNDDTTSSIQINDDSVTAKQGDLVIYGELEFIYDGAKWHEFGSTGSLKKLAFKDTATGDYTPTGSVSVPTFEGTSGNVSVRGTPEGTITISTESSGSPNYTPAGTNTAPTTTVELETTTVNSITNVGTLPSCTFPNYSVENETLTISEGSFSTGALPTKGKDVTVATSVKSAKTTAPIFKGTGTELKATFNGDEITSTGEFTPEGTITKPDFTGTAGRVTVS